MLLPLALLATAAAQDMVRINGGWATFGTSFSDEDIPKEFAPKDEEGEQLAGLWGNLMVYGTVPGVDPCGSVKLSNYFD